MENNFDSYLYYCRNYSLFARWQRYMSDDDNKKYNYFIDIWSNAQYFANDIANDKDPLPQLERMLSFLPLSPNDNIKSYYNICIMHTIWVITGDKRLEKWILYWTEVANEEVKRINKGEDSVSEIFCDFMSTIKKYKRVLIDINKGLVDIFNDLSIMSWRYDKSKVMNDEERADFINKLIDILRDVDIDDVEEYETTITETKAITKADETITQTKTKTITKTDETKTKTKTKTETKTETETEENSVDVILQNYKPFNNEYFISAMQKAIDKGWIKIKDGKYKWVGFEEVKSNFNAALVYFIGKGLNLKTDVEKVKDPATDKMKEQLTYDSRQDAINRFPKEEINSLFGKSLIISQWKQIFTVQKKQVWREVIDKFFDENKENKENNIQ